MSKEFKKEGWSCKARVKTIISGNETHIVKYVGNHIHPPCFPPENPKEIDLESDYNKVKPLKIQSIGDVLGHGAKRKNS